MLIHLLIAVLVLLLLGALPAWPWSRHWGYLGAAGTAAILLVVVYLARVRVF